MIATNRTIKHLPFLTSLTKLNASYLQIDVRHLTNLQHATVTKLGLDSGLTELQSLTSLALPLPIQEQDTHFRDFVLKFPNLTKLQIDPLSFVQKLTQLTCLTMRYSTSATVQPSWFKGLTNLRKLKVCLNRINPISLSHLTNLTTLKIRPDENSKR